MTTIRIREALLLVVSMVIEGGSAVVLGGGAHADASSRVPSALAALSASAASAALSPPDVLLLSDPVLTSNCRKQPPGWQDSQGRRCTLTADPRGARWLRRLEARLRDGPACDAGREVVQVDDALQLLSHQQLTLCGVQLGWHVADRLVRFQAGHVQVHTGQLIEDCRAVIAAPASRRRPSMVRFTSSASMHSDACARTVASV